MSTWHTRSQRRPLRFWIGILALPAIAGVTAEAQERRARIDVEHYTIEADVNPRTQVVEAKVQVRFIPLDDKVGSASFELNDALKVSRVVDEGGQQIPASRSQQDFTIRLNFPTPLVKGTPTTLTFSYDGRLAGVEESPVSGIKFAAIRQDSGYLMYPSRWFPVNDYNADRYTADMRISVPAEYRVVAGGIEGSPDRATADKVVYSFRYLKPTFGGSLAVVQGEGVRASSQGVTTQVYFRENKGMSAAYGEEVGKVMSFLTGVFGLPPQASLVLVETEAGTPNGYAGPGIVFLAPGAIGSQPNLRLLANQVSRQWWGGLVSASTRNHLWITNGLARYSELLYLEHVNGPAAFDAELRDVFIEALTVDNPPLIQAARLEDYSPEYWAATAGKGAAVFQMLRAVIGDQAFTQTLKAFSEQYSYRPASTENLRRAAEAVAGADLGYFFIQWIESSGAPEFKMEYTVFRTQKGFRVMGKISQDLDTFRMPAELRIETEGNPEEKRVEVVGMSSEFAVETFGKPLRVILDPNNRVLRYSNAMRVAVAIRKGEQFTEVNEFGEALKEYQKALDVSRNSSLAHYRVAAVFFLQNNYQSAANEFREALSGDLEPKWTEVWSRINLGKIFDISNQRDRAVNEYNLAIRTKDNTQGAQEEAAKYLKEPYKRPPQNN